MIMSARDTRESSNVRRNELSNVLRGEETLRKLTVDTITRRGTSDKIDTSKR